MFQKVPSEFTSFVLGLLTLFCVQQCLKDPRPAGLQHGSKLKMDPYDKDQEGEEEKDIIQNSTPALADSEEEESDHSSGSEESSQGTTTSSIRSSSRMVGSIGVIKDQEHADLYPSTTVMCADIVGFTAWSSVREPKQVFALLETLYATFDSIAARSNVFKVETVRDSYVAVCGLPVKRNDHAIVMAGFAKDCIKAMKPLVEELEISLGPDTSGKKLKAM